MLWLWRVTVLVFTALTIAGCATPYQPMGARGGYEDEALGGGRYHINVVGNAYTSPGTLEEYFFRRAKEIAATHGYAGYRVIDLRSGYERGLTRLRPAVRGVIEGVGGRTAAKKGESPRGTVLTGTGIVVSADGVILTNRHVVPDCRTITIHRLDGSTIPARLLASDAENDLAILKAALGATGVVGFRDGAAIRQGDAIAAVGFPLSGLLSSGTTLTTGTVSALAGMRNDSRFLQISAPVQPGNSGGPLLDQSGNLVGVVESKL